jgi:hypothetical protein
MTVRIRLLCLSLSWRKTVTFIFTLLTEISFRICIVYVCVCVYSTHGYHVMSGERDEPKENTFTFCVGEMSDLTR